jgi:ParB-like chromosome segregation protein Spo0J
LQIIALRCFQRLLDLPGYDVATLAEKTGKSDSLIYTRLALLQLIPEVAEAFREERITASHANLIARLPQDSQKEAFRAVLAERLAGQGTAFTPREVRLCMDRQQRLGTIADTPLPLRLGANSKTGSAPE